MKVNPTISNCLRNFFDKHQSVRELLPYAVAKRIAFSLPIPPTMKNLRVQFRSEHEYKVISIISKINEKFYFNTKGCLQATYAFWNTRCQLVYNPESIDFINLLVSSRVGLIAPEIINKINKDRNSDELKEIMSLDSLIAREIDTDV